MNNSKDFFSTSDINLASVLLTMGYDISGINPVNDKRVVFYFDMEKYPDLEARVDDYWGNNVKLNPKSFMHSRRELFARINEVQRRLREE